MQDKFLHKLRDFAIVFLVGKYRNEKINFPDKKDLRIFFPDLHMYTENRRLDKKYTCYTNHINDNFLENLLNFINNFKSSLHGDEKLYVYQLGDYVDIWREIEFPCLKKISTLENILSGIVDDKRKVWQLFNKLKTKFVLGNHDFELFRIPSTQNKWKDMLLFLKNTDKIDTAAVLHGDIFSLVEILPNLLKELGVWLLSPKEEKQAQKEIAKIIKSNKDQLSTDYIKKTEKPTSVKCDLIETDGNIPSEWNVKRVEDSSKNELKHFAKANEFLSELKTKEIKYEGVNTVFIGHTHSPRIVAKDEGNKFFVLADIGGWIHNMNANLRKTDESIEPYNQPNAQIGVLSDNEIRIYQLEPK